MREAAEKLQREEVERQSRKNRVAAIMARTRAAKGGSTTPNKVCVSYFVDIYLSF